MKKRIEQLKNNEAVLYMDKDTTIEELEKELSSPLGTLRVKRVN